MPRGWRREFGLPRTNARSRPRSGRWAKPGAAVSAGASGPESDAVVECGRGPRAARTSGGQVRTRRPSHLWDRRPVGTKSKAKGSYRDPGRSAYARGECQWAALALRAGVDGDSRGGAFPFLTALGPFERSPQQRGHRHKTLPEGAGQRIGLLHHWLLGREGAEWLRAPRREASCSSRAATRPT